MAAPFSSLNGLLRRILSAEIRHGHWICLSDYLIFLTVWTVIAIVVCGGLADLLTRKNSKRVRRKTILGACLLPIIGCCYLVGCFIVISLVQFFFGRGIGGDDLELPLQNHYQWCAVDVPNSATIYNRTGYSIFEDGPKGVYPGERDVLRDVMELQQTGDFLAGLSDFDDWFLFNTRTQQRVDFHTEDELRVDAAKQGVILRLESCDTFYFHHHGHWEILMALSVMLGVPFVGVIILGKRVWRILRTERSATQL